MTVNQNLWDQRRAGGQIDFVSLEPNAITEEQLIVSLRGLFV
jgi:hypothetical protein